MASAKEAMRRWTDGELTEEEENNLKDNLPELYESVIQKREKQKSGK